MKILNKMQRRAATWILGAFKTSPLEGIKAIAGLMCYDLKLKGLSNKTTLVLSNTRELNRVPSTE